MSVPVDLTNLREMIGHDAEMERALIEEFHTSFHAGITGLKARLEAGDAEAWRSQAHALKGLALNLGAATLADVCKRAQEAQHEEAGTKKEILKQVEAAYQQVKEYLRPLG